MRDRKYALDFFFHFSSNIISNYRLSVYTRKKSFRWHQYHLSQMTIIFVAFQCHYTILYKAQEEGKSSLVIDFRFTTFFVPYFDAHFKSSIFPHTASTSPYTVLLIQCPLLQLLLKGRTLIWEWSPYLSPKRTEIDRRLFRDKSQVQDAL